ncbi:MAG: NAD(P)/FAD-dependent oxidoreductase [Candidatus Parcubacteria bacterium]|nr:NAD(P)/FAD-dependent oxidoreductase [Candidatus Parcubacteria bacterium]
MLENKINRATDIAIIGGGPAGLSAGIYAALDKTDFLLIEEKESCWFSKEAVNSHYYVDGFTGTTAKTTGADLQKAFVKHYERLGGKFLMEKVTGVDKNDNFFIIDTDKSIITAKAVIFANGTIPRDLNVNNADKFAADIHYYCTIDGPQYKNKEVLVLGGRNSGAVAACYLDDLGCQVTLLELKDKIQAKEKYQGNIKKRKIKVITNSELISLECEQGLKNGIVNRRAGLFGC